MCPLHTIDGHDSAARVMCMCCFQRHCWQRLLTSYDNASMCKDMLKADAHMNRVTVFGAANMQNARQQSREIDIMRHRAESHTSGPGQKMVDNGSPHNPPGATTSLRFPRRVRAAVLDHGCSPASVHCVDSTRDSNPITLLTVNTPQLMTKPTLAVQSHLPEGLRTRPALCRMKSASAEVQEMLCALPKVK
ncbi:hypothetical protein BDZ85DRAFT_84058 [Elsinoe ampelina]|uniref:Uncharacterized protein n=1 Tax=Elsinoe ampelina TaxID=302913 RepID=A0A6A6GGG3_9PEZI|nr:hypothetical protein BDZ85DRAFT_84058 [Elsinoe ampelina]